MGNGTDKTTPLDTQSALEVQRLCDRIGKLITGRPAPVQGATLASLLATWLAGHIVRDDPAGTSKLRGDLLESHIDLVLDLLPLAVEDIHGRKAPH